MVSTEGVKVQAQGICIFILQTTDSNCGNGLEGCSFVNFSGVRSSPDLINSAASASPPRWTGLAAGHSGPVSRPQSHFLVPGRRNPLWSEHLFGGTNIYGVEARAGAMMLVASHPSGITWSWSFCTWLMSLSMMSYPCGPRWTVGPLGASTFLLCKMGRSQRWNKDRVASCGHSV